MLNHSRTAIGLLLIASGLLGAMSTAVARDIFVDNVVGSDAGEGSRAKPFQTIERAVGALAPSDALHLTPTGQPYVPTHVISITVGGTTNQPLVIDGHGAVISGLRRYGAAAWTDEGDGVYSLPFVNNTWMKRHWEGFDLVFFDGRPGKSCVSRAMIEPFGYVLFTQRMQFKELADAPLDVLFIKLPDGQTPADIEVKSADRAGLSIGADYVTVRNLTSSWNRGDGFGSGFSHGIVFENVDGSYNMDQGMSHHSSDVVIRDSHFHHNAGTGVADIRMNSKTSARSRYVNCLIEDDTFRGGVEFHDGVYTMESCIIRNNAGSVLLLANNPSISPGGNTAVFRNCVFIGDGSPAALIEVRQNCGVEFTNCTFAGLGGGIHFSCVVTNHPIRIAHSAFLDCERLYRVRGFDRGVSAFVATHNYYTPGTITIDNTIYGTNDWDAYCQASGQDADSLMAPDTQARSPYTPTGLPTGVGATLDPHPVVGPQVPPDTAAPVSSWPSPGW